MPASLVRTKSLNALGNSLPKFGCGRKYWLVCAVRAVVVLCSNVAASGVPELCCAVHAHERANKSAHLCCFKTIEITAAS